LFCFFSSQGEQASHHVSCSLLGLAKSACIDAFFLWIEKNVLGEREQKKKKLKPNSK